MKRAHCEGFDSITLRPGGPIGSSDGLSLLNTDDRNRATVSRFNDFINARDIEGLSAMMTEDHTFIDAARRQVVGKLECIRAWQGFFAAFPDYRNDFENISTNEELVIIVGRSSCTDSRLDGPALWSAKVRGDHISEWRVFEDTPPNRKTLGLANAGHE